MKLFYGFYFSIFIFILFSAASCNYYKDPYPLSVTSVKYNDTNDTVEIKLSEYIKMSKTEVDWDEICTAEGNKISDSYFEDYIINLVMSNPYNPVTDEGKKIYFNDKLFKAQENEAFGDYRNYYIENKSKAIRF